HREHAARPVQIFTQPHSRIVDDLQYVVLLPRLRGHRPVQVRLVGCRAGGIAAKSRARRVDPQHVDANAQSQRCMACGATDHTSNFATGARRETLSPVSDRSHLALKSSAPTLPEAPEPPLRALSLYVDSAAPVVIAIRISRR